MAAFLDCTNLTNITLPKVTTIGNNAFQNCTSLTSIDLPKVTTIGNFAFSDCTNLKNITLPEVTTIGEYAFYDTSITSLSLPEVTTIGAYAFQSCTNLKTVTQLTKVTTIGEYAFENIGITSLSLPEVTTIGDGAFKNCTSLKTVTQLTKVTTIGEYAFYGTSITEVDLPKVTTIGEYAFYDTSITEIYIPKVTTIGMYAFLNCTNLTSLSLPEVTTIGYGAFLNCTKLTDLTILAETPPTLGDYAFNGISSNAILYTVNPDAYNGWSSYFNGGINRLTYPVTISNAGYATFSAPVATTIPTGVTALYAYKNDATTITLREITGTEIPANFGVVIKGTQGSYYFVSCVSSETAPTGNILLNTASASGTTVDGDYVLANFSGGVGFYKANAGITIPENKAYFHPTATANPSKGFTFDEGGLTGIDNTTIQSGSTTKAYYNFNGIKEQNPAKGKTYIVNGKKIILN